MTSRKKIWVSTAVAALLVPASSFAVSFDCTKAQSFREKSVCSNAELGKLDDQLAAAYQIAKGTWGDQQNLKDSQRKWMSEANRCADEVCIANAYRDRIAELDGSDAEEGDTDNVEEPGGEPTPAGNAGRIEDRHKEEAPQPNRQAEEADQQALEADRKEAAAVQQRAKEEEDEQARQYEEQRAENFRRDQEERQAQAARFTQEAAEARKVAEAQFAEQQQAAARNAEAARLAESQRQAEEQAKIEARNQPKAPAEPGSAAGEDFSLKGLNFNISLKAAEAVLSEMNQNCFGEPLEDEENLLGNGERIQCSISVFNQNARISVYFLDDHLKYVSVENLDGGDKIPHAAFTALAEKYGATPKVEVSKPNEQGVFSYEGTIEDKSGNKFVIQADGVEIPLDDKGRKVPMLGKATLSMVSHDMESIVKRRKSELKADRRAQQKAQTDKAKGDL